MDEAGIALRLDAVSKRYPGTLAVDRVDWQVYSGEVHALVGENGAGKSTLVKMIAGSFDDYTGAIRIGGAPVALRSPAAARAHGIQLIRQELSLAPLLSVAENILAGRLPGRRGMLDRRALHTLARRWLERVGLDLSPDTPVEDLSPHQAQLVEIAKALANAPCILIMDEPTSALSRDETARLFEIVRQLRRQGLAVIYISHHLPEIMEIADRVSVMRDGRMIGTWEIGEVTPASLVERMIGGAVSDLYAERRPATDREVLRVEGLTRRGFFHGCSFALRAGEILGLGGLCGAGRTELARSLCRLDPGDGGAAWLEGRPFAPRSYAAAVRAGVAYLPEDRKQVGLALRLPMGENLAAAVLRRLARFGLFDGRAADALAGRMAATLQIQPPDPRREMAGFSGGNQQKVLLAKWLATEPKVLILDEPTRGVDVGAKSAIHRAIADYANRGGAVLLVSSDLPELVGLADRIAIMRRGRIIGELSGAACTETAVLLAANGELPGSAA